jgi:hypothetical protein
VPAALRITDGNPVWLSQSIVPSKDTVVSAGMSPTLAAITVNSQNIYVYVKVDNTGTVDLGACSCPVPVPAQWPSLPFFAGYRASPPSANVNETNAASNTTFTQGPYGDSITGTGLNYSFGLAAGQRAWAWSPDGRFFALGRSSSLNGSDWYLTIVALQPVQRPNGTTVARGQVAASVGNVFAGPWNNASFFRWAASRAVLVAGAVAGGGGGTIVTVACPFAPSGGSYGTTLPPTAGQVDWIFLSSPCGAVVALVPRILVQPNSRDIEVISTVTAQTTQFRKNNIPTSVSITGPNPTITTRQKTANGVDVVTGSGTVTVDDPDCTNVAGGGVLAAVDRVRASTLPNANQGVQSVGVGVASLIKQGQSLWVQVPNSNTSGWANQGVSHWCLLAQAYTQDGTTIAKPWNGQAASPAPFPIGQDNCAQRNVMIS